MWQSEGLKDRACKKAFLWWLSTQPLVSQMLQSYNTLHRCRGWTFTLYWMCFLSAAYGLGVLQLSGSIFQHAEASISLHLPGAQPTFSFSSTISQQCMASAHTHTHIHAQTQKTQLFDLSCQVKEWIIIKHLKNGRRFKICLNNLCKNVNSSGHLIYAMMNIGSVLLTGRH